MTKFQMTCSCGDIMSVEAETRDEAVQKMKGTMTAEAIVAHMSEKHPGGPVPTIEEMHAGIDKDLQPAT